MGSPMGNIGEKFAKKTTTTKTKKRQWKIKSKLIKTLTIYAKIAKKDLLKCNTMQNLSLYLFLYLVFICLVSPVFPEIVFFSPKGPYLSNRCLFLTFSLLTPAFFHLCFFLALVSFHPVSFLTPSSQFFLFLTLSSFSPLSFLTPVSFSPLSLSQLNIFLTYVSFSPLSPSHCCLLLSLIYFWPVSLSHRCLLLTPVSFSAHYISNRCLFLTSLLLTPVSFSA
jgi:hypothetical protein